MYKRGTFTGKLISLERFYSRHISFLFEESEKETQYSLRSARRSGQEKNWELEQLFN